MLGRSNLIESDECWSTPGGGCTSTAEYAWAAINGSREGWNHHETLGAIQNAIGNRIVGSLRRMLKQTGGLFQQSAFCIPGFAPTRNGAGRHQEAHRLKQPIRMNGVRHLAPFDSPRDCAGWPCSRLSVLQSGKAISTLALYNMGRQLHSTS